MTQKGKTNKTLVALVLILAALIAIATLTTFYLYPAQKTTSYNNIANFQACVDAGFPVMESYPRKCQTPDGTTFTEIIRPDNTISFNTSDLPIPHDSKKQTAKNVIINNQSDWSEYFSTSPPLNLAEYTIIAVFAGMKSNGGYSYQITTIMESENSISVNLMERIPGEACITPQIITYPYDVVAIPKTQKQITFTLEEITNNC